MSGDIIWLASYPKSGNTWFRAFISNLLNEKSEEIDINQLKTDGIFSSRAIFDSIAGVEASNLTAAEIDRLRPRVYQHLARTAERTLFIKVHDAYTYLEDGTPLMGTVNAKAIYIMRNPLDVAVSFANHASKDLDRIIKNMADESFTFCKNQKSLANQLRQQLLTWGAHVESWAQATEIPVHLVRYEDMKLSPIKTFSDAVLFMGLDCSEEQIKTAIELSDFKKLKAEEKERGFREKPSGVESFFRKGEVGDWRNHLTEAQRDRIIADHEVTMRKFGYLDEEGKVVY
jgi:aryl sulfotransferase